jgi:hypothetical protein
VTETYRLKIKIGQHEFEAEGAADVVQKQFQAFKELIVSLPEASVPQLSNPIAEASRNPALATRNWNTEPNAPPSAPTNAPDFSKIMKVDDRIISLTVRPESLEDAVMLILLGQKELRASELSTGGEIMRGLMATGGFSVTRIDKTLAKLGRLGDLIVIGDHRSKKYRLTNAGLTRVRQIANVLLATVA